MNNSYASTVQKKIIPILEFDNPTEEQGIIFPLKPNLVLKQYLIALKVKVVHAKNIIAASRISQDRILIFLESKELVDSFIDNGASIEIENEIIKGRRLCKPTKRIIFSNVSATIPNSKHS